MRYFRQCGAVSRAFVLIASVIVNTGGKGNENEQAYLYTASAKWRLAAMGA
jgi:hypothetical protein